MTRYLIRLTGICFAVWLVSCSHANRIPSGVLAEKQMANILLDMQMASAYSDMYVPDTNRRQLNPELRLKTLYAQVLALHHTNRKQFMDSYGFYEQHPDLMKKVYQNMQDSVDRKSAYQDSVSQRFNRLRMDQMRLRSLSEKNYLMLYRHAADSFPPKAIRVFRPDS